MTVHSFKDLQVWQKSRLLVKQVYIATRDFPKEELYGLTSQMRRAVISIASNIAEGSAKKTTPEFLRFLNITHGSLAELQAQLIVACDLEYLSQKTLDSLLESSEEIGRMIHGLIRSLKEKSDHSTLETIL